VVEHSLPESVETGVTVAVEFALELAVPDAFEGVAFFAESLCKEVLMPESAGSDAGELPLLASFVAGLETATGGSVAAEPVLAVPESEPLTTPCEDLVGAAVPPALARLVA
jgi:hypothetical protein